MKGYKESWEDIYLEHGVPKPITVKCTYSNGDTVTTGINTDLQGAKGYFLGKTFDMTIGDGTEILAKCIKVEEIQ